MVVTITATLISKANTENAEKPHIKVNWQPPKNPLMLCKHRQEHATKLELLL